MQKEQFCGIGRKNGRRMVAGTPAVLVLCGSMLVVGALGLYVVERNERPGAFLEKRTDIFKNEEKRMLGGDLILKDYEIPANETLMRLKIREIDEGSENPANFLPAQNYLRAASKIAKSPVYQVIQSMPKGAILHAHDTAIVSFDYVFNNITYRPDLYVCEVNGTLSMRFWGKPENDCDWQLLHKLREKRNDIDDLIRQKMTMVNESAEFPYRTVDDAWSKFVSIFRFITPMLTYRPVYEDHFYQGLLEAYKDNVLFLELRSTLPTLYELNGTTYDEVQVAKIYKQVTDRFIEDHPDFIGMKLIYAPLRRCNTSELKTYVKTAEALKNELGSFIAGFDLVGQEEKGETLHKFADELRALGQDVNLFFHAGETNWYGTDVDENLIDAVLLNTKRIGHGFALLKHPRVMELVREKGIAIEVAPISNQVLSLLRDLRNHPASVLFAENYPVVVSNDDPGLWGAQALSYDFYEAFVGIMSRRADLRALKKLALNSIQYSSMDEDQKNSANEIWNQRWLEFVEKLAKNISVDEIGLAH